MYLMSSSMVVQLLILEKRIQFPFLFWNHSSADPSRIEIKLNAGAAKYGNLTSTSVIKVFSHSLITGYEDLTLWYGFEEPSNSIDIIDFSKSSIDGVLDNSVRLPGKFGYSVSFDESGSIFC